MFYLLGKKNSEKPNDAGEGGGRHSPPCTFER